MVGTRFSTEQKQRQSKFLSISKRGNTYFITLLIHSARQ